jgi:hypothetical protein
MQLAGEVEPLHDGELLTREPTAGRASAVGSGAGVMPDRQCAHG